MISEFIEVWLANKFNKLDFVMLFKSIIGKIPRINMPLVICKLKRSNSDVQIFNFILIN